MNNKLFEYKSTNKNLGSYNIVFYHDKLCIDGCFYKVRNREIENCTNGHAEIPINEYLGSSNLVIKSERKFDQILIPYIVLAVIRMIVDNIAKIFGYRDTVNDIVAFDIKNIVSNYIIGIVQNFIPIPYPLDVFNIIICIIQLIMVVLIIRYLLSKKNVYEWTGTRDRFAVDKESMPEYIYFNLIDLIDKEKRR